MSPAIRAFEYNFSISQFPALRKQKWAKKTDTGVFKKLNQPVTHIQKKKKVKKACKLAGVPVIKVQVLCKYSVGT